MTGWLVIGAGGRLVRELCAPLPADLTIAVTRKGIDLSDPHAVGGALSELRPSVVANCAAWTDVDGAEGHESWALEVNGRASAWLGGGCARAGARLLHVSTDYVFSGIDADGRPCDEDAVPDLRTVYGHSKLVGERNVMTALPGSGIVVRTAWHYGTNGSSCVSTMAERAMNDTALCVVTDQIGQPIWTGDVAERLLLLDNSRARPGIHHATATGSTSSYELAREIYRLLGRAPGLVSPAAIGDLGCAAVRPAWSVLGHRRWAREGISPLWEWRSALREVLSAITASLASASALCAS
ncbi:SDR family oxidoreductase [Streptomyces sp. NPDC091376]|uniref:SDR family oxidoreductase n=1 Tax=Streptomyces sp. NPDC091376 TaxID=3365994 RepID=UPI0038181999